LFEEAAAAVSQRTTQSQIVDYIQESSVLSRDGSGSDDHLSASSPWLPSDHL